MKKRGLILGHEIGVNRGMREFKVERRIYLNREWDLILSGKLEDDGDIKVRLDLFSKVYKTVAKKKGLNVKEASAENLPFPDKSFDVGYSFKVLAHVQGIEKALAEIERVAKPGAVLVLEFYNPFSIKYLVNFFQPKNVFIRYDSVERVKAMLPKNLRIVGKRGIRIISPAFFLFHFPVLGLSLIHI